MSVTVGQAVPDFSAAATGEHTVRLAELRGQRDETEPYRGAQN